MGVDKIFGGWNTFPTQGRIDKVSALWHALAAQNIGTDSFRSNSGLTQRRAEIVTLWDFFLRARPQVIVEAGVAQGGTFAGWCKLADWNCTIIAIDRDLNDSWPRPGNPVHPMLYNGPTLMYDQGGGVNHLIHHKIQHFHGINGWTHDIKTQAQLTECLHGRGIDWLFHDASHYHEDFVKDFEWMWPLVSDGGCFVSHDIMHCNDERSNKAPGWEYVKKTYPYSALFEFTGPRNENALGIGLMVK